MITAIYKQYGAPDVVQISDMPKPIHKDNEILINICATSVNSGDCRMRSLNVPRGFGWPIRIYLGISKPKRQILGVECAGIVEKIGKNVTRFKPNDRVFINDDFGCHAEYRCIAEDGAIALMPKNISFEQAACMSFGGVVALGYLGNKANLNQTDNLLINGATSTTGLASLQYAKYIGAHVTAICSSKNFDLMKTLNADKMIDYQEQDFTKNGQQYDIILDCVGNLPLSRVKNSLQKNGRLIWLAPTLAQVLQSVFNKNLIIDMPKITHKMLKELADLTAEKKLVPIIDKIFEFNDIARAHEYVDTGRKTGSVVVKLPQNN